VENKKEIFLLVGEKLFCLRPTAGKIRA
jgi:hypothetical protein